ncbi:MAG: hypothetical protein ACPGUC_10490, partial [Gammaproteobacteria bacterium]
MPAVAPASVFVATSGHGLGHLSQVAPLINALRARRSDLKVIVQSTVGEEQIRERIPGYRTRVPIAPDLGILMNGPMTVRHRGTFQAYETLHSHWDEALEFQKDLLRVHHASLVIGDVPYLPLAAASALGIPAFGVCSLNWADVFSHYCTDLDPMGASVIDRQIRAAYDQANAFFRCTPAMPMERLRKVREIGPLVNAARPARKALNEAIGAGTHDRIVLISPGGMSWREQPGGWPDLPGIHWLIPQGWRDLGPRCHRTSDLDLDFQTVVASVDALITKPGYGLYTEAAQAGTPTMTLLRGDWPEEAFLLPWLRRWVPVEVIGAEQLMAGDIRDALRALLSAGRG